jgi:hypothetical protein
MDCASFFNQVISFVNNLAYDVPFMNEIACKRSLSGSLIVSKLNFEA